MLGSGQLGVMFGSLSLSLVSLSATRGFTVGLRRSGHRVISPRGRAGGHGCGVQQVRLLRRHGGKRRLFPQSFVIFRMHSSIGLFFIGLVRRTCFTILLSLSLSLLDNGFSRGRECGTCGYACAMHVGRGTHTHTRTQHAKCCSHATIVSR